MSTVNGRATKSVIVTGGGSGIGLAVVRLFASEGHRVAILDIDHALGEKVSAEIASEFPAATISFTRCDVSSWAEQAAAFKMAFHNHGDQLDIVIANAGISEGGVSSTIDFEEAEPTEPRLDSINVNLIGVVYSVKLASHYMNRNRASQMKGSIICTASNAGIYPFPIAPMYAASKAGVIGLVRSLARPLAKFGIQINALAPAVLETNIAPSKALFKHMKITPMSTLLRAVSGFLADPERSGEVAEIHGDSVTVRPHHDYVDEDSADNLEMFWSLGYA